MMRTLSRPSRPADCIAAQSAAEVPMSAVAVMPTAKGAVLRLGEGLGELCRRGRRNFGADELHGRIDQQAGRIAVGVALDLAADRVLGRSCDAGGLQRRAVHDERMAVDALEHDGPVATPRRRDRLPSGSAFGPKFLVPTAARGSTDRWAARLHRRCSRCCRSATEFVPTRSSCSAAKPERPSRAHARRSGRAARSVRRRRRAVGHRAGCRPRRRSVHDLAVVADQQAVEAAAASRRDPTWMPLALSISVSAERRRGEKRCGERDDRLAHRRRIALFDRRGRASACAHAQTSSVQPPTIDDIRAAAKRIEGAVVRTPMLHEPDTERDHRRGSLAEVREPAVHRRLQGARGAQQIAAADARGDGRAG